MSVNKVKQLDLNKIYCGDVLKVLEKFPDGSVDCIITSPPYWNLREYGWINVTDKKCKHEKKNNVCIKCGAKYLPEMIGLEPTIKEHIDVMVKIFTECKRVLADYGSLWLNYGDTYIDKSMAMVPEQVALGLKADGWILRNKIIWHKPSVVPQSAKDRFTHDHEMIYFFTKSNGALWYYNPVSKKTVTKKPTNDDGIEDIDWVWVKRKNGKKVKRTLWQSIDYYFEQQFQECKSGTPQAENDRKRMIAGRKTYDKGKHNGSGLQTPFVAGSIVNGTPMRNMRSVWTISSQAVKDAHFATFPFALLETPIKAGCTELVCTGKQNPVTKHITRPTEAFNIRIRDVKEGRDKHIDRVASDEEVVGYNEAEYQKEMMQQEYTETLIDGCGQPVKKIVQLDVKKKHYDREKIVSERGDKGCIPEYEAKIVGEQMIDGCGQPVKKIFEKEYSPDKVDRAGKKALETRANIGQRGDYTIEEIQIDGCGKPVKKIIEKKFEKNQLPRKKVTKPNDFIFDKSHDGTYTIEETQIDGCGKPVIPVIEMIETITGNRPNDGVRNGKVGTIRGGMQLIEKNRVPIRKPTTTATHCSCGAPFRRGIVLDPFMGSGTTAIVARALDRDYVGIELNPEYIEIAEKRLEEWDKERVLAKLNGKPFKTHLAKISKIGFNGKKLVPNPLI